MKVLHLADIHIKNSRFVEYDYVFNKLYEKAKMLEPDFIVVAGDIFDDKTSAEAIVIDSISKFITNLSLIAKRRLILIQGNHDTHIEAKEDKRSQFELLTVILDILKPVNTSYFKKTGIYIEGDVLFGVLDPYKRETLDLPKIDNNCKLFKIGLFHEEMVGAKYFNGDAKHATIGQAVFDGYDIVLGGHIHKRQFLAPNIAYCGSLIQQNIGEFHTGHGFILWNDNIPEEHDIYNPYACVKIIIRGDVNITMLPIPENPREWYLDTDSDIIECFGKPCVNVIKRGANNGDNVDDIINDNIFDEQPHENIIRDILNGYDDDIIEAVVAKYKEENEGELRQRKTITLLSMEFSNLFCYGKNNVIDFTKLTGISGVNSKNESGKSAIIRLILIGLYGKYSDLGASEIVRRGEKSGSIKIIFIFGSQKYMIDRLISSLCKATIYEEIDGEFVEIVKTNKTETENFIKNLLGNIDNVINSSFILNDHKLIYATPAERKVLLMNALNLNTFKNHTVVIKNYTESSNKIKALESQKKDLDKLNADKIIIADKMEELQKLIKNETNNLEILDNVSLYEKNIDKLKNYIKNVNSIDNIYSADELLLEYMKYNQLDKEIKNTIALISNIRILSNDILESQLLIIDTTINNLNTDIGQCKQNLADICAQIEHNSLLLSKYCSSDVKNMIDRYNVLSGINCCDKMRDIIKNINVTPEMLAFNTVECNNKIRQLYCEKERNINNMTNIENKINRLNVENTNIQNSLRQNNENRAALDKFMKQLELLKLEARKYENIDGYIKYLYDISVKYVKDSNCISYNKSIENKRLHVEELARYNILSIENDLFINGEIKRAAIYDEEYKQYKFLEAYKKVLDPSGIISKLIDIRIKKLEIIINDILNACSDNKVTVHIMDVKSKDEYKILFKNKNVELPAICASGFRKLSISLAINLALWKITNGTVINGIFIDEGLSSCDKDNLISMSEFIRSITVMEDMPKIIFLISHNEQVKSQIDNAIEIEMGENCNRVCNAEIVVKPLSEQVSVDYTYDMDDKTYIICACGARIKKSGYNTHKKTDRHKTAIM